MISIEEARKILGKKYEHLTDNQIKGITAWLYSFCGRVIDEVVAKKDK